ncbi:MAG: ADP compounds hydrolase NudE [Methylococcales bacterium]|nr:ADP compounds hydrolase NudE [Methylococcales bacterium]
MLKKPTILNRQDVCQSRLFAIESMDIVFSNGEQRQYERLKRNGSYGAVLIVPLLDDETVLLIREYSAGVDRYELGLPKGKIDANEAVLEAANRELKEEVGYGAKNLQQLTSLTLAPGYMEHNIHIIVAQDLYPEKLEGDEPEELEVVPWKLSDIKGLIATQECSEARSIAALYMTADYLRSIK